MSKKIKEINIEAFRAYEKLQAFDFSHNESGNIADLVVIYAPNGYGKTSFFDAIEWAITDEIGRFKSTDAIKQEVKNEKGDILKNKNSDALQGTVRIISENGSIFEIKTKKRTGNMKSDYKPGDLEPIPNELQELLNEKNTFCTTNMLAHDKITSFLQNYTAEDKTKALQVFWDNNGYSEILEVINNLHNEIVKKEKALATEVQKEERELKQYKYESDKEYEVRQVINNFNVNSIDFKINLENLIENIDTALEKTASILKTVQDNKLQNEAKLNTLELLTIEFPNYLSNKEDLDIKKAEKIEYEKKLEILTRIDKLMVHKEKLQSEKKQICEVIAGWSLYQSTEMEILSKNDLKKEANNAKPELQKSIIQIKDNINICKENVSNYTELKKKELEEKNLIEIELGKFNNNTVCLNKYSRLHNKASYLLSQRLEKRKVSSNAISSIESFIENKCGIDQIKNYISSEVLDTNERLTALKIEKSNREKQIVQLGEHYKNAMLLNDKVNQLVIQGKELVENSKSCECPLCHAKYEDFSTLISRISVEYKSSSELDSIKKDLEESKKLNAETIENIAIESEKLKKSIQDTSKRIQEEFNRQNERIHSLQLRISDWNNLITNIQNDNENMKRKYDSKNVNIQDIEAINLLKTQMDKNVFDLSKNIESEETKITTNLDLVKNLEIKLKNEELKIIELDEKISEVKNNDIYQAILVFLVSKNLRNENDDLQSVLKKIENEKNDISKSIVETEAEITNSQNKIQGAKEEINLQYNSLLIKIQESTAVLDGYLLRCTKAFENISVEEKDIGEQLEKQKTNLLGKKSKIDESIAVLNSILNDIKSLQEQKIWLDKKKEHERKKSKLDVLQAKQQNLKNSKTVVEDYIVKQTNAYFNSNTINQIYHKIDPHPTMNHIKFLTESSGKGLQTHIYTYDKSEEDKMSPVLYLSSAQVNILSLCIFLAKVLTERGTTFNTIFMDDPIQHLDGINLLAFIDLLRTITTVMGRQIVISTHNEHFYNLIKVKMDDRYYLSKFIELNSVGEISKKYK
ncbi:AAA family ATPase [Petroclostridium sp. X23]|uniref:AAA family ATPase n=1 Tax=Petroclostridium sp. X23 TaxID=3045146 RepID=UPI0024AD78D8|nr:AAA family ATPase [Petroclostridium sp. X23]WHH58831.1 AAA family ATPase [Petroclostridium sp. X23]